MSQPFLFLLLFGNFSKAHQYLNNQAIIYNIDSTWNNSRYNQPSSLMHFPLNYFPLTLPIKLPYLFLSENEIRIKKAIVRHSLKFVAFGSKTRKNQCINYVTPAVDTTHRSIHFKTHIANKHCA